MVVDNCYVVLPETAEEVQIMNAAILKHREEKQRQEMIKACKDAISSEIADAIEKIGLAETKLIVRTLARELRGIADEN